MHIKLVQYEIFIMKLFSSTTEHPNIKYWVYMMQLTKQKFSGLQRIPIFLSSAAALVFLLKISKINTPLVLQ